MSRMHVMEKSGPSAIACLTVKSNGWVLDRVLENNCHQIRPLRVSGGTEQWHVVTENVSDIKNLLSSLKEIGEVKVHRIGKYAPERKTQWLTAKQRRAFSLAVERGYYCWPRKVSLEELAQVAKISRKVYQDHLRKAESKLMPRIAKEITEVY